MIQYPYGKCTFERALTRTASIDPLADVGSSTPGFPFGSGQDVTVNIKGAVLFVGDDWAETHHDIEIENGEGMVVARRRLPEGLAGITMLHELLRSI